MTDLIEKIEFVQPLWLFAAEALLAAAVLLFRRPLRAPLWLERHAAGRWALVTPALACLLLRLALLPVRPIPEPCIHDEFSYLLAADTFASGRLVNPPHPHWRHFESFHIMVEPAYYSKYPPLQGAAMAAGQAIFGHPWFGVWMSVGAMLVAFSWMLRGWLPHGWAFLGTCLAALRLGLLSYWMNSYWGGAVAAAGGALLLGGWLRLRVRPRPRDAALLALGAAILAQSRPFEGLILTLASTAVFRRALWPLRMRVLAPAAAVAAAAALCIGYFNYRVTGRPGRMPYVEHERRYAVVPSFVFQRMRAPAPEYRHDVMRRYHASEKALGVFERSRTAAGLVRRNVSRLLNWWLFYVGPILLAPFLMGLLAAPALAVTGALFFACVAFGIWFFPHYAAPASCLAAGVTTAGLRRLWDARGRRRAWASAVPVALACACALPLLAPAFGVAVRSNHPFDPVTPWNAPAPSIADRARIQRELERLPGGHLVLVRYAADHDVGLEWVYNRADIDGSRVVWARETDPASNADLLRYFAGRKAWLVEPDGRPVRLIPYPAKAGAPFDRTARNSLE